MSQEEQNYEQAYEVSFGFVDNDPIEATFTISQNIQDLNYIHYQDVAAEKWVITHNLGKMPSVTVVTSAGEQVVGDVQYNSTSKLTIGFSAAFAGVAYLN